MAHIYALVCSIANVNEVPDKYLFNVGRLYGSAEAVGLHSQLSDLSKFDDIDRLVLAGLALKRALLQAGSIRLYPREPHWRAALGACGMDDFL